MCMADWQALDQQNNKGHPGFMKTVPQWLQAKKLMRQLFAKVASNKPKSSDVKVGPWQGVVPVQDQEGPGRVTMEGITMVAWNVKGTFSQIGGMHNRDARIASIVQSLKNVGAVMAVISDGQLGPWTGYHSYGEKSDKPNTVNIRIHKYFTGHITEITEINHNRIMWFEIPDMADAQGQQATMVLVCGVYGLHPKYPVAQRQKLWEDI